MGLGMGLVMGFGGLGPILGRYKDNRKEHGTTVGLGL